MDTISLLGTCHGSAIDFQSFVYLVLVPILTLIIGSSFHLLKKQTFPKAPLKISFAKIEYIGSSHMKGTLFLVSKKTG